MNILYPAEGCIYIQLMYVFISSWCMYLYPADVYIYIQLWDVFISSREMYLYPAEGCIYIQLWDVFISSWEMYLYPAEGCIYSQLWDVFIFGFHILVSCYMLCSYICIQVSPGLTLFHFIISQKLCVWKKNSRCLFFILCHFFTMAKLINNLIFYLKIKENNVVWLNVVCMLYVVCCMLYVCML